MKNLINLFFVLLMLLCVPVFLYFIHSKTNVSNDTDKTKNSASLLQNEIQIKNLQIARLKKENADLKARAQSPLSRPPRPFGQGAQYTDSNSQSPLSRPPRRVGTDYEFREVNEALRSVEYHDE